MSAVPLRHLSPERTARLRRRVRLIVAATISYNMVEAVVAITAGRIASSTALVGFGLDSLVEVASAAAVAWQFAGRDHAARERTALRVIAVSFLALAAYVTVDAVRSLAGADAAAPSSWSRSATGSTRRPTTARKPDRNGERPGPALGGRRNRG